MPFFVTFLRDCRRVLVGDFWRGDGAFPRGKDWRRMAFFALQRRVEGWESFGRILLSADKWVQPRVEYYAPRRNERFIFARR